MKLKKTTFMVKTQKSVNISANGCIRIDKEETYNNMNKAMFDFNKPRFNPLHKSFYSQTWKCMKTLKPRGDICSG